MNYLICRFNKTTPIVVTLLAGVFATSATAADLTQLPVLQATVSAMMRLAQDERRMPTPATADWQPLDFSFIGRGHESSSTLESAIASLERELARIEEADAGTRGSNIFEQISERSAVAAAHVQLIAARYVSQVPARDPLIRGRWNAATAGQLADVLEKHWSFISDMIRTNAEQGAIAAPEVRQLILGFAQGVMPTISALLRGDERSVTIGAHLFRHTLGLTSLVDDAFAANGRYELASLGLEGEFSKQSLNNSTIIAKYLRLPTPPPPDRPPPPIAEASTQAYSSGSGYSESETESSSLDAWEQGSQTKADEGQPWRESSESESGMSVAREYTPHDWAAAAAAANDHGDILALGDRDLGQVQVALSTETDTAWLLKAWLLAETYRIGNERASLTLPSETSPSRHLIRLASLAESLAYDLFDDPSTRAMATRGRFDALHRVVRASNSGTIAPFPERLGEKLAEVIQLHSGFIEKDLSRDRRYPALREFRAMIATAAAGACNTLAAGK